MFPDAAEARDHDIGAVDLSGACPATVIVQTDWNPSAEHGFTYEMLGPDPVIDADSKSVVGPLFTGGEYTGVDLEIRAGGPAIGYQDVQSQMYVDPDITFGYIQTDGQIMNSSDLPAVAVMAPLETSPQFIMWDPETYPDATTIADIGGYDGAPANFVASGGTDAQQGFATSEPYVYEHEVPSWNRPIAYELVADAGYPNYTGTMAVRSDAVDGLDECLRALVPVMQQAEVDFYDDPTRSLDTIVEAVEAYDTGIVYTRGAADFGVESALDTGVVSNGDNETIGDFDAGRMRELVEIVVPIAEDSGTSPAEGLTPEDLYTNDYIDPSIGL